MGVGEFRLHSNNHSKGRSGMDDRRVEGGARGDAALDIAAVRLQRPGRARSGPRLKPESDRGECPLLILVMYALVNNYGKAALRLTWLRYKDGSGRLVNYHSPKEYGREVAACAAATILDTEQN
ncbi:hypothetical protein EVAR_17780_1 [Eumeta japonica]|uniref:Uncharacterized protein n=1 Tax=Eumeta variegata TaxID=151549 RepID=A0A4C1TTE5_EUMVA|nr:hypothetical protein EVAR_17780_1 [Eumeta japonica]